MRGLGATELINFLGWSGWLAGENRLEPGHCSAVSQSMLSSVRGHPTMEARAQYYGISFCLGYLDEV